RVLLLQTQPFPGEYGRDRRLQRLLDAGVHHALRDLPETERQQRRGPHDTRDGQRDHLAVGCQLSRRGHGPRRHVGLDPERLEVPANCCLSLASAIGVPLDRRPDDAAARRIVGELSRPSVLEVLIMRTRQLLTLLTILIPAAAQAIQLHWTSGST